MSFILIGSLISLFFFLISLSIKPLKPYKLLTFSIFIAISVLYYELINNTTNIFVINPTSPITLNYKIINSLTKYNIPLPELKVHRFISNTIVISKKQIVLPVDYVKFKQKDYNLIFLRYIENYTTSKERVAQLNKIVADATKSGKKYLFPLESEKLKHIRTASDIDQILKDGGETICHYNISQFKKECIFTELSQLNMDIHLKVSLDEFNKNLENNFDILVDYRMKNNQYSQYLNNNIAFNMDSDMIFKF